MKPVTKKVIKNEFCKVLQKMLLKMFDIDVSLEKAYGIFKLCVFLPFHIATKNDAKVVLGGVGIFRTYKTNHTGTEVPKFYGSEAVTRILTKGQNLLDYVLNPQLFRDPNADPEAVAKKAPAKKAEEPKKSAKAPAKKAKAKKAPVEEVENIEVDEEIIEEESKKAPAKKAKETTKKAPSKKVEVEKELADEVEDEDFDLDDFEL